MPLTELQVRNAKPRQKPYKLLDDRGLYLLITPSGSRLWRLRFTLHGRENMHSLGAYPDVSLARAREKRDDARRLIADGVNPSVHRRATRSAQANTFNSVSEEWLAMMEGKLAAVTLKEARRQLLKLLGPYIGSRPIGDIEPVDLLGPLKRIESRGRNETAHKTKRRAGQVFRYAISTGRAKRDPTRDLKDALAPVRTKHRAAITEPQRVGELLRAIHSYQGQPTTEVALKLLPLVFVRSQELRYASWEQFDLDGRHPEWRIPFRIMKAQEYHVVPLARQAVELLKDLLPITGPYGLLFPSLRAGNRPMSNNTINAALRRLGYPSEDVCGHGFRTTASTLLNEQGYPPDVIELQLAHAERNKVRAAYNRAKRIAERREMMQAWADYLDGLREGSAAKIVNIHRSRG
jgi:integrase